jgi:hypothetical protein
MKYVKLFESWVNSMNEAIDANKIQKLKGLGFAYDEEESYAKSPESFAKYIANTVNKMFAKNSDYKITLAPKTMVKKVILTVESASIETLKGSNFTFEFDKKTFEPEDSNILSVEGKAKLSSSEGYQDQTTFAQFILSCLTLEKLEASSDEARNNAMDQILYISQNDNTGSSKIAGKRGNVEISKMTIDNFISLPEDAKVQLIEKTLGGDFSAYPVDGHPTQFEIYIKKDIRKKNGIKFSSEDPKLLLQIDLPLGPKGVFVKKEMTQEDIDKMHAENKGKYEKELQKSIADLTIYWKTVDKNDTSANNTISQDKESTLATFVMDLRRIAKNGFDNVDTIEKFYSSIDVKNDSKQTSLAANQWQNLSNTVNLAPKEPK